MSLSICQKFGWLYGLCVDMMPAYGTSCICWLVRVWRSVLIPLLKRGKGRSMVGGRVVMWICLMIIMVAMTRVRRCCGGSSRSACVCGVGIHEGTKLLIQRRSHAQCLITTKTTQVALFICSS